MIYDKWAILEHLFYLFICHCFEDINPLLLSPISQDSIKQRSSGLETVTGKLVSDLAVLLEAHS
jgi:hypothetical protein